MTIKNKKRKFNFPNGNYLIEPYQWFLDKILKYLEDPEVEDFQISKEGEAKLLKTRGKLEIIKNPEFTIKQIKNLTQVIANMNRKEIDLDNPTISIILPVHSMRYTCKIGKDIKSGIELSIRVPSFELFQPKDFNLKDIEFRFLQKYISIEGKNAFFIGSTGSGKTSFANMLVAHIPTNENIKIIGDIHDYMFKKEQSVSEYYAKTKEDYQKCIDIIVRTNPTRILVPELTTVNVNTIFRLINTGHTGFYLTLHANESFLSVIDAFYQNAKANSESIDKEHVKSLLEEYVDFFIFLKKDSKGVRQVNKVIINNKELLKKAKKYKLFGYSNETTLTKKKYKKANIKLILKLRNEEGLTIREIQEKTGHSTKTIQKYIKNSALNELKNILKDTEPQKQKYKQINVLHLLNLRYKKQLSIRDIREKTGYSVKTIIKYLKILKNNQ